MTELEANITSDTKAVSDGHVHFSEDTDEIGHTLINIKVKNENNIEAHIGFLQVYHRYVIAFRIPRKFAKLPTIKDDVPSLSTKIVKLEFTDNSSCGELDAQIEFFAYKEKLLKEKVTLVDKDGTEVVLTIFSRVLGKGKGTPMLRENVTCIGVEAPDDETEASDWQGFE